MLYCNRCGYRVKINAAIKGHVRNQPYRYDCKCGNWFYISQEDVDEANKKKFYWLDSRNRRK